MTVTATDQVMLEDDARRLTEKIRITAHTYAEAREKLIGYVEQAKDGNAHVALGYRSWTEYLSEVLGEEPMRLARDDRREVVQLLSNEGMTTRAIAPILNVDQKTVVNDRRTLAEENSSPAPAPSADPARETLTFDSGINFTDKGEAPDIDTRTIVNRETGEIVYEGPIEDAPNPFRRDRQSETTKLTGLDGKTYTRPEPRRQKVPKSPRTRKTPDEAGLINDIRLFLRALPDRPEVSRLSPTGKQYIIDALQETIDAMKGIIQ